MPQVELHLTDTLATALTRLGWTASDALLRDTTPTTARGHHLVVVVPPSPGYAVPALAGMLSRPEVDERGGTVLALSPRELLHEWASLIGALLAGTDLRALVAHGAGRNAFPSREKPPHLLLASPATALELRRRGIPAGDQIAGMLLLWPERWENPDTLAALLTDISRDTQRVIVTSAPAQSATVIERHAWRALTVGEPAGELVAQGPVRTASVAWSRRVTALPELAQLLDPAPESLAVWTVDRSRHEEIRRALSGIGIPVEVTHMRPGKASAVIAFDPPSYERLGELREAGTVVLLVPPGTEAWTARIASPRVPLRVPGALETAAEDAGGRRARIDRTVERGDLESHLLALAPLFERHDATAVAAAIYQLWLSADQGDHTPTHQPTTVTRLWVGVGRKDEVRPSDLVGLLANELKIDRSLIGRVEVRETYSLIEVPEGEAERIAQAMTGRTVRRRRLVARVDRKRGG